jgi:hypothetical protein
MQKKKVFQPSSQTIMVESNDQGSKDDQEESKTSKMGGKYKCEIRFSNPNNRVRCHQKMQKKFKKEHKKVFKVSPKS